MKEIIICSNNKKDQILKYKTGQLLTQASEGAEKPKGKEAKSPFLKPVLLSEGFRISRSVGAAYIQHNEPLKDSRLHRLKGIE